MKPLDPRILRYVRQARLPIGVLVVLGLATAALIIVQAQLLASGIAGVFGGGRLTTGLLAVLAVVIGVRMAVAWAGEAAAYQASATVKSALRMRVLSRAVQLGPRWLAGQRAAALATLATDGMESLDGYFSRYLPQLVLACVVPLAVVIRVGVADPLAGLTMLVTLPLVPVFGALTGRKAASAAASRWAALASLSHHFLDVVSGLPTLKVFGRARAQRESVAKVTDSYRVASMATLRVAFLSSLVLELIATVSVALVAVGVGLSLAYGHLSLRTGLLALILAPEAYLPLRQAAAQFHASADGLAAMDQALTVIETDDAAPAVASLPAPALDAPPGVPSLPTPAPDAPIAAAELTVRHPGRATPAPSGVSFAARAGTITVLAGPSGCGKSTVLDVLLGFCAPSSGAVRTVDRSLIGWVPQEPYLFPGTVAANIRLGWPGAPQAAVAKAAAAAALDDVPLDRLLTEGGGGLSAGQRRRVALARALLPARPVLLLDEPTAGLDVDREAQVLDTLRAEAAHGRVIVIATHHPSVLAVAHQLIQLTGSAAAGSAAADGCGNQPPMTGWLPQPSEPVYDAGSAR